MNKGKFIQLDYDLNEVHESKIDNQIFVKGSKWADVKEKDFKRKVLKFREKNSLPKEWAKNLSSILKQSHSQKSIEKIYHGVFGDTLE